MEKVGRGWIMKTPKNGMRPKEEKCCGAMVRLSKIAMDLRFDNPIASQQFLFLSLFFNSYLGFGMDDGLTDRLQVVVDGNEVFIRVDMGPEKQE